MIHDPKFARYGGRLRALIECAPEHPRFEELALELFQLHLAANPVYRRFCERRGRDEVSYWQDIPALPTAAFKEQEVTWLPSEKRTTVFHSSGTTSAKPSRHFHDAATLAVYEASLLSGFCSCVAWENDLSFLALSPPPEQAPHSSLVHMFGTLQHGLRTKGFCYAARPDEQGAWQLEPQLARTALEETRAEQRPVVLLGPAYAFVQLLEALPQFLLPAGSRAMETGGYKGRTRTLSKTGLRQRISRQFGLAEGFVVSEYGMSELSSQAYDGRAGYSEGIFRFPPWARALIVSPETGREVAEGEAGLIRVIDLANVSSAPAVQTEDLGIRRGTGFEWVGRAEPAEARGCSLMMSDPAEGG